jgi:hypothetical protein
MNVELINKLKLLVEENKIPKSKILFGGANLIITSNADSPYPDNHNERHPLDIVIRTKYCYELSWIIMQLGTAFHNEIDYINKYYFYTTIGELIEKGISNQSSLEEICFEIIILSEQIFNSQSRPLPLSKKDLEEIDRILLDNIEYIDTELAKNISIRNYLLYFKGSRKKEIADMVYTRFYERYMKVYFFNNSKFKEEYKNGFSMMASACLVIEAYMSFRDGVKDTKKGCKKSFENFFADREQLFSNINGTEFYKNIRCGILHQGETKKGWKLTRKDSEPLFNKNNLTINAHKFMKQLETILGDYRQELIEADWNDDIWVNLRKKLEYIIHNCKVD